MNQPTASPSGSSPDTLNGSVMCIAVTFEDAVHGCGRALTHQAQWGRRIVVVLLTDVARDRAEIGGGEVRALGLTRGAVGACPELVSKLHALIEECSPSIIYAPAPGAADPDRRAACHALASALASGPRRDLTWYEGERPHRTPTVDSREALTTVTSSRKPITDALAATAVVSTWNKKDDVRMNLQSLRAQTLPFADIVVVDNHSSDGTAEMITREFPEVRLIEMPHDKLGACETFNIGFKASRTPLTAILDDDIVMPPNWLEKATARIAREPATTAVLSTQVVEPGMPEEYKNSQLVNEERYMSTFRGCASLARSQALKEAGYYDERLFIYGNERDLTCRLLNLGYRVLQYPECGVFHRTPFGIKMGKRSLYYHARNAWLSMLKYAPLSDLVRMPWLVVKVVLRSDRREAEGGVRDAVGTIGIGKSLRETKGAWWVVTKAALNVLVNIPYCLKHRRPVKSPDFELPIH